MSAISASRLACIETDLMLATAGLGQELWSWTLFELAAFRSECGSTITVAVSLASSVAPVGRQALGANRAQAIALAIRLGFICWFAIHPFFAGQERGVLYAIAPYSPVQSYAETLSKISAGSR
jgi:hypothetical protein